MPSGFRRVLAWCALFAFTGTFGLGAETFGHSGPDDDAACRQELLTAGHPGTQFATATTVPVPTHCPFCHWQRMVSGATIASAAGIVNPLGPIETLNPVSNWSTGSTALDLQSSRGPPA
jgi:hypothetical protein